MKTSESKLLITAELTGAYDFDHSTMPEVVMTSKRSNMTGYTSDTTNADET